MKLLKTFKLILIVLGLGLSLLVAMVSASRPVEGWLRFFALWSTLFLAFPFYINLIEFRIFNTYPRRFFVSLLCLGGFYLCQYGATADQRPVWNFDDNLLHGAILFCIFAFISFRPPPE